MQRRNFSHSSRESLPRVFKAVRIARGLSQEDFYDVSGRTYISSIERGVKHPTPAKLDELARTLDIHPLTLLTLSYLESSVNQTGLSALLEHVRVQVEQLNLPELTKKTQV